MGQEQRRVPPLLLGPLGDEHLAGPPVDGAGEVPLLVVPRRLNGGLTPSGYPHRADPHIHLVLEHGGLVIGQVGEQAAQGVELGLPLGVLRPDDRAESAVD